MLNRLRIFSLALVAAFAFGCVSNSLPEDADYRHRYYAAFADYNQAKRVALAYVRLESTPDEHVFAIHTAVLRTNMEIIRFEELRRDVQAKRIDYVRVITMASELLRAYAVRGQL